MKAAVLMAHRLVTRRVSRVVLVSMLRSSTITNLWKMSLYDFLCHHSPWSLSVLFEVKQSLWLKFYIFSAISFYSEEMMIIICFLQVGVRFPLATHGTPDH